MCYGTNGASSSSRKFTNPKTNESYEITFQNVSGSNDETTISNGQTPRLYFSV